MSSIIFILNDTEYSLPRQRKYLNQIPDDREELYNELYSGKSYNVKSKVKNEIFQTYLNCWKEGTTPEITSENIMEYYLLSDEFGIFKDYITSPQFVPLFNVINLIDTTGNLNFNKELIEKQIAHNLAEL